MTNCQSKRGHFANDVIALAMLLLGFVAFSSPRARGTKRSRRAGARQTESETFAAASRRHPAPGSG